MKKVLLISNKVMHYRVSVYNYFAKSFADAGWEFIVRSNELQKQNPHPLNFDFKEVEFDVGKYKEEIEKIRPDVVILFLHLKDRILWPLLLWLKWRHIPVVSWTKGMNLDTPNSKLRRLIFNCMHTLCDGLILYSGNEIKYLYEANRKKVSVANNTVNFADFPVIDETKETLKQKWKIPFEKVVLSVGRMDEGNGRKKVDHLIEIFRDIEMPGAGLVIVGAGVNGKLHDRMNTKNTVYLGEIYDPAHRQISEIFKMADVFSIPGHVGLGLNQAFYWGLPVVTEEGKQPPEIYYLVDGRNGFIVPENDIKALKNKIIFLLGNDAVREKYSLDAKNTILKYGSIENMYLGFKISVENVFERSKSTP